MNFEDTSEIPVPDKVIDSIIGQDNVIEVIKKASKQRRHVLLIGHSGTGKSMCGQGMTELLPNEKLVDILSIDNPSDDNNPLIKTVPRGEGKKLIQKAKIQAMSSMKNQNIIFFMLLVLSLITPWWIRSKYGDIMGAASLIGSMLLLGSYVLFMNLSRRSNLIGQQTRIPKLLVDNSEKTKAPFIDASGAQVDALLGTVLHDPLQSFSSSVKIRKKNGKTTNISVEVNRLLKKHEKELIKEKGYLAAFLKKDELYILAEKNGKIQPVQVLSINKYKSNNPYLYKITTESGKTLTITPEHKVAVKNKGRQQYLPASKLKEGKEIFVNH